MPWIESHTVLLRHRKLLFTAKELGIKPVYLLGHLHALWHTVLEQQEDGDLSQWPDTMIAEAACYGANATRFVSLLKKYKWIDANGLVHDWLDYAGLFLARKYGRKKEKLQAVWEKYGKCYGDERAKVPKDCTTVAVQQSSNIPGRLGSSFSEGKPIAANSTSLPPEIDLAQRFHFAQTRRKEPIDAMETTFREILRRGHAFADVLADIKRKDRDANEWLSQFAARWSKLAAAAERKPMGNREIALVTGVDE